MDELPVRVETLEGGGKQEKRRLCPVRVASNIYPSFMLMPAITTHVSSQYLLPSSCLVSRLISSDLISPHLVWSHPVSSHLISSRFVSLSLVCLPIQVDGSFGSKLALSKATNEWNFDWLAANAIQSKWAAVKRSKQEEKPKPKRKRKSKLKQIRTRRRRRRLISLLSLITRLVLNWGSCSRFECLQHQHAFIVYVYVCYLHPKQRSTFNEASRFGNIQQVQLVGCLLACCFGPINTLARAQCC